jgi:hypothetical protein
VQILEAKAGKEAPSTVEATIDLAALLARRGQYDEARKLLAGVGEAVRAKFVEQAPARRLFADLQKQLATG